MVPEDEGGVVSINLQETTCEVADCKALQLSVSEEIQGEVAKLPSPFVSLDQEVSDINKERGSPSQNEITVNTGGQAPTTETAKVSAAAPDELRKQAGVESARDRRALRVTSERRAEPVSTATRAGGRQQRRARASAEARGWQAAAPGRSARRGAAGVGCARRWRRQCAGSPLPVSHGAVSVESSGGGSGRGPEVPVSAPSTSCCGPLPQRPARSSSALPAGRPVATVRRTRQRKTPQLRRSLTAHSISVPDPEITGRCMLHSRSAGLILQVLLSGGTCRHTFAPPRKRGSVKTGHDRLLACRDGVTMIGAMPAVAVRHERRKQEKRAGGGGGGGRRPSQLQLQLAALKGRGSPPSRATSPSPSPQSPPSVRQLDDPFSREIYVCGKVSILHLLVVSLLLGTVLLIVGLVQLKPGADASDHRYALLGAGGALVVIGAILTSVRCRLLPCYEATSASHECIQRQHSQLETQQQEQESQLPEQNENNETPAVEDNSVVVEQHLSMSGGSHGAFLSSPSEHDALLIPTSSSQNTVHAVSHTPSNCNCDPEKACTTVSNS
ncbi:uncharacterized protein LOC126335871 [Schistocerca gregaria]|uniref:uncharacterized protein LOC126335871 n=1 Tax=Schistocerca gregaria TaxID=7010 RepID=UPI00211F238A|nr:uncharacterized protein LOC126335871 [Schistocerca gregaria]